MAWYDNTNTGGMKSVTYDPTDTREKIARSEGQETLNQKNQYDLKQKQNMDAAFSNTVEKKKVVDPNTGAVTYSFYLDPDKYARTLFDISKQSGVPFDMDAAKQFSTYQLGRIQNTNQQAQGVIQGKQMGITPEAQINPTRTETTSKPLPEAQAGETRKGKDGKTYTYDGTGWYDASQEGVGF